MASDQAGSGQRLFKGGKILPKGRRGIRRIAISFALLGLILALCASGLWYRGMSDRLHQHAMFHARLYMEQFENSVKRSVLVTGMLEAVLRDQHGVIRNFPQLARFILGGNPNITSLQLAPNGVVTDIYPEAGSQAGKIDLFADPERRGDAIAARDSGRIMISGPLDLRQGGTGLIIRRPVYIDRLDGGKPYFWGFAIVILDPKAIFDKVELRSSPGFRFSVCFDVSVPGQEGFKQVFKQGRPGGPSTAVLKADFLDRSWQVVLSPVLRIGQIYPGILIFAAVWLSAVLMGISVGYARYFDESRLALLEMNARLEDLSARDPLTGLLNRSGFHEGIEQWQRSNPGGKACLAVIDVDDFKRINDVYGHQSGDRVLRAVAAELAESFKENALIARTGGDEFAIFIHSCDCASCASKLSEFARRRHQACSEKLCIIASTSVGCACYPDDAGSTDLLVHKADIALYHTKTHGKQGISFYEHAMSQENRMQLGFNIEDLSANIPGGLLIYTNDREERLLFASEHLYRNLGFSSLAGFMDFYQRSFRKFVHPDDLDRVEREIAQQQAQEQNEHLDYVSYRVFDKHGRPRDYIDVGKLIRNEYYGELYFVLLLEINDRANKAFRLKRTQA